jgi:hypothetical protein
VLKFTTPRVAQCVLITIIGIFFYFQKRWRWSCKFRNRRTGSRNEKNYCNFSVWIPGSKFMGSYNRFFGATARKVVNTLTRHRNRTHLRKIFLMSWDSRHQTYSWIGVAQYTWSLLRQSVVRLKRTLFWVCTYYWFSMYSLLDVCLKALYEYIPRYACR